MRIWPSILCFLCIGSSVLGYDADQNLFFLAGKEATLAEGDMFHRAVYFMAVPQHVAETLYVRVFDADLAGKHDRWQPDSEARYRVYGAGGIDWTVRNIDDPLPQRLPLAELSVGENIAYDDQWRTIAAIDPDEGELLAGMRYFQLVVDGIRGRALNKYQIFISDQEKDNNPIAGIQMTSPVVMLYVPATPGLATQLQFDIPAEAEYLEIFNFDADLVEKQATFSFETRFVQAVPIASSRDEEIVSTRVAVRPEDRGTTGAVVLRNPKEANHIQFWMMDSAGKAVPFQLPTFTGPDNHLPAAEFTDIPLSECLTILLDASSSFDKDQDELRFEWQFPDGPRTSGSRIVHQFPEAGTYKVTLVVSDNSGFVANSSRVTRTIHINQPPVAVIDGPEVVPLDRTFTLDASLSQDADGTVMKYLWNMGDGTKVDGDRVTHSYDRPGKYKVTLVVEDDSRSLCSQARTTQWIQVNAAPVPRLNVTPIGAIDEVIALNADGSSDSDGEIQRYAWEFGDGATAEGKTVTHAWTRPGTYTIRLKVTDDAHVANSSSSTESTVIINDSPVPQAEYREIIAAQESVPFDGTLSVDPDGVIRRYTWDMGDGFQKEGGIIWHAYETPGVYTVTLRVTDNTDTLNNTTSMTFAVRVNFPPEPVAGDDLVVNSSEVFFDAGASTDRDDPILNYVWDFGDGTQQQGQTVTHVYALPGTYPVTLTVTDASGTRTARQSDTLTVIVNHVPIADAGGAQVVAPGEVVVLDGSFSEDPDGEIVAYQWEFSEKSLADGAIVKHVYDTPGRYQARLTVTDNTGAEDMDYATITVNARPIASFVPVPRVAPEQLVTFNGSSSHDEDGALTQTIWDFSDGTPLQQGLDVQHQFNAPGRYVVTLRVQDDSPAANNSASHSQIVAVNFPPQAEAGPDIQTCSQTVTFDGSQSTDPDGDALLYHWDFGDGTRGQGRRVEHKYHSPGIYPVSLTVTDGYELRNSVAQTSLTAYVNAPPAAAINIGSDTVCAGELVLFDAGRSTDLEQGLLRYHWDLGDGTLIEGINPVREYTEGGDYRIRLQVTDDSGLACNTSQAETMLHVIDAPIADAGEDQTVCANMAVQFDGSASTGGGRRIKSYEWDFDDDQFGVGVNPAHVYAEAGEYTVRLLITVAGDGQCSNVSEDEVAIRVMAAPVATFQVQKAACVAEILEFDATASFSSEGELVAFDWDFGDGMSAPGKVVKHAYDAPGTYHPRVLITSDSQGTCRTAEYTETITINAVPEPAISVAAAGQEPCSEEQYHTETHTILYFSGADSIDSDGYIASYAWDFGDGQYGEGAFLTHQYSSPGTYEVTLQVQDNSQTTCNTRVTTRRIHVREAENQPIKGPTKVCAGQSVTYSVDAESNPVEWRLNDGTTADGNRFEHVFETPGTYQLQAKIGVDRMPAQEISVLRLPDIALPGRLDVYPGDVVDIQPIYDTSTALPLQFQWNMGDGTLYDSARVSHQYTILGDLTAALLVNIPDGPACLQTTYFIPVTIHTPPELVIEVSPEQIFTGGAHDAVTFEAALQGKADLWNYEWDFGDGGTAIGQRVSHTYRQSGTFKVRVTLSDPLLRTEQTYQVSREIEVKLRQP